MSTIRLTAAQACVRYLANQYIEFEGTEVPYFAGVWAIFGHGNVAGLGEALTDVQDLLPTYRAHNEQAMAHAAIAYAKQMRRQRAMVCTSSIGPGATNMVTAAALAHVNRLPVLFLPGDVYASRRPDPVLQQVEDFGDGTVSANDSFRPVSRYFDRIVRPEQLLDSLPRALATMLDPVTCGPATLAFCQDVQAEAFDYPDSFFQRRVWRVRRAAPERQDIRRLAEAIRQSARPLLIAGGGVHYSIASDELASFASAFGMSVAETQAGKGSLPWDHPQSLGSIGVTGSSAANSAAAEADLVIGIGTRLQDFTTGSWALFENPRATFVQVNVSPHDAHKRGAFALVADAKLVLDALADELGEWRPKDRNRYTGAVAAWNASWETVTAAGNEELPSDAQVIGAVWRTVPENAIVVGAAGGLPGELHKLWRSRTSDGYHLEYGYSCMGYEIAGGLGVKLAALDREVVVMLGDGSYLMLNSEIATSVMIGAKLIIVLLDNHGFGCINRLQQATAGERFNNLLPATSRIDFVAHAKALGATAVKASSIAELEAALGRALAADQTYVVVIDTDPERSTDAGGAWWDVAIAEVSKRKNVAEARKSYDDQIGKVRR
ncbi:3D-(3,5/4)-trihydroxycyclohexane-1,2-dione acylhydrolase (decyclizing) [Sphingomonas sp. RB56-2]|uniref:3D-(3,5/4)-trihydroxycyclohexane-1,2-dione acylhydrolase (Decyclizing) n=1 Tax=Sphingomonas brevis TaxID=2908206 RepID=A0ABT0S9P1_9SPHN|nr:3D-(3,5/4)-trihydroxycyclohexane-1,2-dione acylhydrolase (decyclizing) [Sphingomonas brevis]MCL6740796.1 3D-(3,5/4)-trihydroxycyclohexane-1,2-dione acylhydrolase (decyclizing) [Sphingomonas brevis]